MRNQLNRHTELHSLLERLNLAAMAQAFADVALKAAKEGLSHEAYLFELATLEEEQRTQRRTARLLRQSGLPQEKTFRTFDLQRLSPALQLHIERLKSGVFLEQATNVIVVGKPGVGKSHPAFCRGLRAHCSWTSYLVDAQQYTDPTLDFPPSATCAYHKN